jgi:hypothetical protein
MALRSRFESMLGAQNRFCHARVAILERLRWTLSTDGSGRLCACPSGLTDLDARSPSSMGAWASAGKPRMPGTFFRC